ncbi:methyltransferase [Sphingobacterium athyrii]|uniref:SAM-dependent methyltransferase n=1 Tax=Sphingobacterium athyrii TaxID=2152717 RepID=A0A363NWB6_9SPHI|nr:methyltransferase [Sphingobacterium athyrii]PUV24951.1 SAM-dependent methyltransferase [Sphingobacterium athyrii]
MDILDLNKDYWDNRYKNMEIGWDIGYASPAIIKYAETVIPKDASILIPGCGNAHEAKALLEQGFENITLLDIAPTLVDQVQKAFGEIPQLQIICQDFFQHEQQYDYILEQTFFCALDPALRKSYSSKIASLLQPRGILAGLLFDREFPSEGPPFGGNKTEYQHLFHSAFDILKMETCFNSISQRQGSELFIELRQK